MVLYFYICFTKARRAEASKEAKGQERDEGMRRRAKHLPNESSDCDDACRLLLVVSEMERDDSEKNVRTRWTLREDRWANVECTSCILLI
jgi:hypothetical protein